MKGVAIIVYLVLATQSHIPLTPQQIISNYETGTNITGNPKNFSVKIDSKGCQNVWDTIQSNHGGSSILVYKYCPTK